jgi:hypothetical protein
MPARQITATDESIDRLVYELPTMGISSPQGMIYGLSPFYAA